MPGGSPSHLRKSRRGTGRSPWMCMWSHLYHGIMGPCGDWAGGSTCAGFTIKRRHPAREQPDSDAGQAAVAMPAAFALLSGFPKGLGGEVVAMEWCPTMD